MDTKRIREWRQYSRQVENGTLPDILSLLPTTRATKRRHFVATGQNQIDDLKNLLITFWNDNYAVNDTQKDMEMDNQNLSEEEKIFELGMELLTALEKGQKSEVVKLLEVGVPINFQHPKTKSTALHIATAGSNLVAIKMLMKHDNLNYLLRDKWNRIPLDNAMFFSIFPEAVDMIAPNTKKQALREGVDLKEEFKQNLRLWVQQDWYQQLGQDDIYTPPEPD